MYSESQGTVLSSDEDVYSLSDECETLSEVEHSATCSEGEDLDYPTSPTSQDLDVASFDISEVTIESEEPRTRTEKKRTSNSIISRRAKRQQFYFNPSSLPTNECVNVFYLGETENQLQNIDQIFSIEQVIPNFYLPSTNWECRFKFVPDQNLVSNSGLKRVDLAVYAIEANSETNSQISKSNYRRCLSKMRTPIERFYPELWEADTTREQLKKFPFYNEPYENAINGGSSYEEMRCFIGLFLWTSLVQMHSRRSYFTDSEIYYLPHFTAHLPRSRFEQLLTMLHLTDNKHLPANLSTAEKFEAKLGSLLSTYNTNCIRLLSPARSLSIDEMMIKFYGRSAVRRYIKAKPTKYGVKMWSICCGCCGYSLIQNMDIGGVSESVGGRDVVLLLSQPFLGKGHVIYCDRYFSQLDLAAYLRSRRTGLVGTSGIKTLPLDLDYLVEHMHPLTWAFKWFTYQANIDYHHNGMVEKLYAKEPVCLTVWMDKKYRTEDKKVVFITNCISNIPTSTLQFQSKSIKDSSKKYTKQLVPSPPILKAYNNRMGGVDRHDRMVSQHMIPLTSKRGYLKVFFHLLDSAVVNAWILFKTAKRAKGDWNKAAQRRHTLAWFKENVILKLCGDFSIRKQAPAVKLANPALPIQTILGATGHQVQPVSQIPGMIATSARCVRCNIMKRTACVVCKLPYCYECGQVHLQEMLLKHATQPEDMPENVLKDMPENIPENVPEDMPENIPENVPENIPENVPEIMPENIPENILEDAPEDLPKTLPEYFPENIPGSISEATLEDIPGNIKDLPKYIPKNLPGNIPKSLPEDIPKNLPEDIPKNLPGDIPKKLPGDIPKKLPGNIPEDLPRDI